ncbi:hypothetical protein ACQHIV_24660 [Kribbella sp. GL6]|uniref:hypothetical protein n=1 Tax=Kribbella sp. GL6 TaxID=3419765 RepID=UPI003D07D6B5
MKPTPATPTTPATPAVRGARAAVATLPVSLPDGADVTIVDGSGDWPAAVRRALDGGDGAIVVVEPRIAEFGDLLNAPVFVDSPWASNPVVDRAALKVADGNRIECRVIAAPGCDLGDALLHQLTLIRALRSPMRALTIRYRSDNALYAEGTTDDVGVDFSVVCTTAVPTSATVRLLTSDGSVELQIPSGETAQPARLTSVGPDSAVLAPTIYETGHRATLRRLHDTAPADLSHLYDDVQLVLAAVEGGQS